MTEKSNFSRRGFFGAAGHAGAGLVAAPLFAKSSVALATASNSNPKAFSAQSIPTPGQLHPGQTVNFFYPDKFSPCLLFRASGPCKNGVGPEKDIVAYSLLCPHQGFPLSFDSKSKVFKCASHFSQFDGEMSGQMICGQATSKLTRIVLESDESGKQIKAVGIEGLIFGRIDNKLS